VSTSNEKLGLSIGKIGLNFKMADCLAVRSAPSNKLVFENLKAGDFLVDKGTVLFQMESAKSVLIESVVLEWCGGNVDVNAFRVLLDHPENVRATLYCDRLNVAKLLNQVNIANARGGGNVSGRVPLRYSDGKIMVNDGFLYSTPGVGGHLELTDFMGPLASLPSTVQLDITREALKDFDYEWIKLDLNSKGDDLLLKLSLKGAPSRRLPFTYDKKTGGLRRSRTAAEGDAGFQGISFNLNFKLPANRLMEIGRKIKGLAL
ncbi:MAG: YdbH domain-containing protein, partial [Victivallales bacterium]|nr:YdbH domain-containing protein [Victivallales bacterium]